MICASLNLLLLTAIRAKVTDSRSNRGIRTAARQCHLGSSAFAAARRVNQMRRTRCGNLFMFRELRGAPEL